MNMNDKLAELVDKCASTRGAPAAAELFQHIAQLLSEDVERDARLDSRYARRCSASRGRAQLPGPTILARPSPCSTAPGSAAATSATGPRSWPRRKGCTRPPSPLSTFEAAVLDAWPDAADATRRRPP